MKKIIVAVLLAVMLLSCACTEDTSDNTSTFEVIESHLNWSIVYHTKTKVMYTVSTGAGNSGTFTLLVNADGTPMLYEGK